MINKQDLINKLFKKIDLNNEKWANLWNQENHDYEELDNLTITNKTLLDVISILINMEDK